MKLFSKNSYHHQSLECKRKFSWISLEDFYLSLTKRNMNWTCRRKMLVRNTHRSVHRVDTHFYLNTAFIRSEKNGEFCTNISEQRLIFLAFLIFRLVSSDRLSYELYQPHQTGKLIDTRFIHGSQTYIVSDRKNQNFEEISPQKIRFR